MRPEFVAVEDSWTALSISLAGIAGQRVYCARSAPAIGPVEISAIARHIVHVGNLVPSTLFNGFETWMILNFRSAILVREPKPDTERKSGENGWTAKLAAA